MSTLFLFGENLSLYLSWLRTNAGPCLTPRRVGSRGRWWRGSMCFRFAIVALAVAGVDTSCYASRTELLSQLPSLKTVHRTVF